MKNRLMLAVVNLVVVTVAAVGCSQAQSFKSGVDGSSNAASVGCASNKAVDIGGLSIEGSAGAIPGQTVHYKLSADMSCSPSQSVTWADATGTPIGAGSTVASSFKKAGNYVVTAQVLSASSLSPTEVSFKTMVTPGLSLNGPEIGMAAVDNHFELVVPAGQVVTAASWNFNDGSPVQSSTNSIDYAFASAGDHTVSVSVTLASGAVSLVSHTITILAAVDGMECANQLAISGPSTATVGTPISLTLFIPSCIKFRVRSLSWVYGDGTPNDNSQTITHTFATAGSYHVTVSLYSGESNTPLVTLYQDVAVSAVTTVDPGTSPTAPPAPVNECSASGLQRQVTGEIYAETVACGVNGHRTNSYRDTITQTCTLQGDILKWISGTSAKTLINEGACQGQACEVPASAMNGQDPASLGLSLIGGKYYLLDGGTKVFYSSTLPAGSCADVSVVRLCANGVIGGSSTFTNLTCASGCPGFGVSGTTKIGVITGTETVAHTCQYGETGINDLFNTVSDQMCLGGTVSNSNVHRGTIKTAGSCPIYSWVGTESYSACSANCGGNQSRVFTCLDSNGQAAPAARCTATMPVESRVCDGNPDAVKRSDASVVTQEGGQSTMCPSNQIGSIVQERQETTTTNYACVNHSVQQVSQGVTDGPWTEEKYCRDYVPYRCSQDSLSISEGFGRYNWMVKCAPQVPVVKEFLDAFSNYESGSGAAAGLWYKSRTVYATFMVRNGNGSISTWKAPTVASASCTVPAGAYVAAVCTASCATPDQNILAQADDSAKLNYSPIGSTWQAKFKYVATLQSAADMKAKRVVKTAVDNWVTELIDGDHDILTFTTMSGGKLSVTPNHTLLTVSGTMKLASDFVVGEPLVRLGGQGDQIVSITKSVYHGKVYNLFTKTNDLVKNIVVTNGFLNGTAYFQNDGAKFLNKQIFRRNLINGALDGAPAK